MHREPRFLGDDVLHEVAGNGRSPLHEKLDPMNSLPEEVKKLEGARELSTLVIACEDDHEEEITTVRW